MYIYRYLELDHLYVGFYDSNGYWMLESDHETSESAAKRVAWLNSSN